MPFAAGVICAHLGRLPSRWLALCAAVLLVGACFCKWLWLAQPLLATLCLIPLFRLRTKWLRRGLEWVGVLSPFLFASHTLVKDLVLSSFSQMPLPLLVMIYLVAAFAVAGICQRVYRKWLAGLTLRRTVERRINRN